MSSPAKTARVFQNGRSRAIRIPKEFEVDADEVEISRQENGDLIVHPLPRTSLLAWLRSLDPLEPHEWLPEVEDDWPEPVDLGFSPDEPVGNAVRENGLVFQKLVDRDSNWRWQLLDAGCRILAQSADSYPSEADCDAAIDVIRQAWLVRAA
jgi:antitoxin VapB